MTALESGARFANLDESRAHLRDRPRRVDECAPGHSVIIEELRTIASAAWPADGGHPSVLLSPNQPLNLEPVDLLPASRPKENAPTPVLSAKRFRSPPISAPMRKPNWRPTSFKRPDGTVKVVPDDLTLCDAAGRVLARTYHCVFGPNAGLWLWTVLIAAEGAPQNALTASATGCAATGAQAREMCEQMTRALRGECNARTAERRRRASEFR